MESENKLNELVAERETVRAEEKKLTEQIKAERERISAERKASVVSHATAQEVRDLKKMNKTLRCILADILKEDRGETYARISEILYCSPTQAKSYCQQQIQNLRIIQRNVSRGTSEGGDQ